jgi:ABC-type polysaccharide/polyol phosphate export permease
MSDVRFQSNTCKAHTICFQIPEFLIVRLRLSSHILLSPVKTLFTMLVMLNTITGERQNRTLVSLLFLVTNNINWNNNSHTILVVTDTCSSSVTSSDSLITKVGVEESIRYRSRISCLNLTSLFALFVFLLCRLRSGVFIIDSSTPTFRIHLNEHPI